MQELDKVCFGQCSIMSQQRASFGITELFKQTARVTNRTQESRERDQAVTTAPGPSALCMCHRSNGYLKKEMFMGLQKTSAKTPSPHLSQQRVLDWL